MPTTISPWEEHSFWLEILEDHAIFVRDFLSPAEVQWVDYAKRYIAAFRGLRRNLAALPRDLPASAPEMIGIARQAHPLAAGYLEFEGHLQKLRLQNEVLLTTTPTYFNGTRLENQEYIRLLGYFMRGEQPVELPETALIDMWLIDQIGHSLLLDTMLDPTEVELKLRTESFLNRFRAYQAKHISIKGYLQVMPPGFGVQRRFTRELVETIDEFRRFVAQVIELFRRDEVLNRTTLRFLAHHFPETCYFLRKLAAYVPELEIEPCPLTKPYPAEELER